jgi:hypothetical protein
MNRPESPVGDNSDLGAPASPPAPALAHLASALWLALALPFALLALLYWQGWPAGFGSWRGTASAVVAGGCVLMAIVAPARLRVRMIGLQHRWWGRHG